jgi:pyridoxine/pyridoxamine 5'-phosphate oxidase
MVGAYASRQSRVRRERFTARAQSLEAIQKFMETSSVCNVSVIRRCYGLVLEER